MKRNRVMKNLSALEAWFDEDYLWVMLSDGRQLATPISYFPKLLSASPAVRDSFEMSGGGKGLHWNDIDEDISVEGLLLGFGDQPQDKIQVDS